MRHCQHWHWQQSTQLADRYHCMLLLQENKGAARGVAEEGSTGGENQGYAQ
jgi:hypothetical protein